MRLFLSLIALFSACCNLLTLANKLEERQAVVPIITVETVTVTPSVSNAVPSSTTSSSTHSITGSVKAMSGPGASSNGQTGTGAGADASTYTTLDVAGNTFVEVFPSSMVTVTASVRTTGSTTATAMKGSSSSSPPSSSASGSAQSAQSTSSSKAFAVPTALPGQMLGMVGVGAGLLAML